jgi:hypothetical protein
MSTISSLSGLQAQFSPRAGMDKRIASAVSAGSISSVDQTALESALDNIDSALSSGSSTGSTGSTSKLDPKDMKSRIDSLIEDQVSSGTLTADQASELQSFFAQGGPQMASADGGGSDGSGDMSVEGTGGACGAHGPRGAGGPPPSSDDDDDSTTTDTSTTDTATSAMDKLNSLISFLENLRTDMASNTYGTSATTADNSGLLVDAAA